MSEKRNRKKLPEEKEQMKDTNQLEEETRTKDSGRKDENTRTKDHGRKDENAQAKDWMEELKGTLERAVSYRPEENEDADPENPELPTVSKDELQRKLAAMKAEFTHTPMEITPDLKRLLADDLKAEKRNKKRASRNPPGLSSVPPA